MHYILLAVALNLGKENISYMNLADSKKVASEYSTAQQNTTDQNISEAKNDLDVNLPQGNTTPKNVPDGQNTENTNDNSNALPVVSPNDKTLSMIPDDDSNISNTTLPNNNSDFQEPFVGSNNFAELLPEEEVNNATTTTEEEQGPKFLDAIKNKLIAITESPKSNDESKDKNQGPTILDAVKNKVLNGTEKLKETNTHNEKQAEIRKEIKGAAKEEAKNVADASENLGTAMQAAGYAAAPFTAGESMILVGAGKAVEAPGTYINYVLDASEGKYAKATANLVSDRVFGALGNKVKGLENAGKFTKESSGILQFFSDAYNKTLNTITNAFSNSKDKERK